MLLNRKYYFVLLFCSGAIFIEMKEKQLANLTEYAFANLNWLFKLLSVDDILDVVGDENQKPVGSDEKIINPAMLLLTLESESLMRS